MDGYSYTICSYCSHCVPTCMNERLEIGSNIKFDSKILRREELQRKSPLEDRLVR